MDYNTDYTNKIEQDPIKAEKRAEDRAREAELKNRANTAKLHNDVRQTAQDTGADWQDKGTDKAYEAKLNAQAKGKEFSNDAKDFGDKVSDSLHEGVEKVKDFFHRDDRVE